MSIRAEGTDGTLSNVEQLAWRSLRTIVLLGLPELERSFRRYGLVQLEYQVLLALFDAPDGVRMGDLASALQVSASRLSHRMEKLTRGGLVTLEPAHGDARGTVAVITQTGRVLVDRLASRHEEDLRRVLFEPLQQQQVRALADALSTVAASLTLGAQGAGPYGPPGPTTDAGPASPAEKRRWRDALIRDRSRRS